MKNLLKLAAVLCTSVAMNAQTADLFQPYKATDLRMPSVPLVVSDPYFSIWSPYDKLTDGSPRHWTNEEKPLEGLLRVDGKTYRFLGVKNTILETIVPMADEGPWTAAISREKQADGWQAPSFDDSKWKQEKGAFGSDGLSFVRTKWSKENSDLYVRRTVELTPADLEGNLYLVYSHDDVFHIYINGTEVANAGETWREGVKVELTDDMKKLLKPGKNVIASHCHNTTGGAYTDFGLYRNKSVEAAGTEKAVQKSCDVMATSSYYKFACGPVDLDVVFTAPMLIDNYDLLSSPVNYISYQVTSTDGAPHDVQLMLTAHPAIAQNKASQPTRSETLTQGGIKYVRTGTIEQPILAKKGDHICIDWGYLYLPAINGDVCLAPDADVKTSFINKGVLPAGSDEIVASRAADRPLLAYLHNFGKTDKAASYALIGYDEVYDIEYFFKRYKGYWAHNGNVTIFDMFNRLNSSYASIMNRCRELDRTIYDDAEKVGGKKYAELLAASYRHVIAAHKLFQDEDGKLLFFSKENDSNG